MKTVTVNIPEEDYKILKLLAADFPRHSKASVVRKAVDEYCRRKEVNIKNKVLDKTKGAFREAPLDAEKHRRALAERMV